MFTISPTTLVWVAIAVLPGFVFHKIFSLKSPTQRIEHEKNLLEYLLVSLANFAIWCWVFLPYEEYPIEKWSNWRILWVVPVVCFISPALLALGWHWLRTKILHNKLGFDHPTPRGWDYFLSNHKCFCVVFHLKNGKMIGGFFGSKSYASLYPQEPEIYVEQAWRVDEHGKFVEEVSGSLGIVIRQSEWERVEFLEANFEVQPDGKPQSAEGDDGATPGRGTAATTPQTVFPAA